MPSDDQKIPRDNDELGDLHCEIASRFEVRLTALANGFAAVFGEKPAAAALEALLTPHCYPIDARAAFKDRLSNSSLDSFLDAELGRSIDTIELTQLWRAAAEYGGQGCVTRERQGVAPSLSVREERVRKLIATVERVRAGADALVGDYDYILEACLARSALDFGGRLTLRGLQLLSRLPMAGVRNAVSARELHPDASGCVSSDDALAWLSRRREFCPSRWRNLSDDQYGIDPLNIVEPDAKGMIWVPQSADGEPFVPALVGRVARGGGTLSVTIGAKGKEVQYHDFYDALTALAKLDVARWRRRNSVGNWGIVRARGAWVSVSKAEIDRQIAGKTGAAP